MILDTINRISFDTYAAATAGAYIDTDIGTTAAADTTPDAPPYAASFYDRYQDNMYENRLSHADKAKETMEEKNKLLQQFMEWSRVGSETKRMDLLSIILQKEEVESSNDLFGNVVDIARRIMQGQKVAIEEMRYLAKHDPHLLYAAKLLKNPDTEN